ncbi:MAG: TolC family protein [Desulfobacterales bacterium]|nr:TolC family protein [Desulfobacterales bacterium]
MKTMALCLCAALVLIYTSAAGGTQPDPTAAQDTFAATGDTQRSGSSTPRDSALASASEKRPPAGKALEQIAPPAPSPGTHALPLSLLDAILYSMEGNREIQVVAFTPQQSLEDVTSAEAVYDTRLFAEASYRRDPNLESSIFDVVTEDQGLTQTGVRKQLKTGTSISTYLETRYSDLNNSEAQRRYKHIVAPTMELRQHLLNNIGSRKERTAIKIANHQANISEEEFRQTAIAVTNRVAQAYWKLYQFKALVEISRQNYEMAEEIRRRETERLNRGLSQPLDVARAQSSVQQRRSTLLRAQEEYNIAMDRLKLLINWEQFRLATDISVVPIEAPETEPLVVDEAEAIAKALANRSEILKAKQEQMIRQADEDLASHQRLPTLDAYGRYSVSGYDGDFGGAAGDIGFNDEDIWEVGINFEWPLGNRAADARHRRKVLARRQMETIIQRIEDEIRLDVKQALYGIDTARGEIEATRLARAASLKVVEGEFTRFDIGQTSNLELLRAQDLLALSSRNFTRAVVDYNLALHELERAQGVLPKGVTIEKP